MILPMANGTAIVTPLEIHKRPTATEIKKNNGSYFMEK